MDDFLKFKGFSTIGTVLVSEQVEKNIIDFYNWGLLGVGAFYSVRIPTSGTFGGDKSILRGVTDSRYVSGSLWEGFRKEWIWESGVAFTSQPISISGVYVNSTFYPSSTSGAFAHTINYRDGQVIFDSPIPANSKVQCEFSYRAVNVVSLDSPTFKTITDFVDRVDTVSFNSVASGDWNVLSQNRIELPTIGIGIGPEGVQRGMQLGGGQYLYHTADFYFLASTTVMRNKMMDIVRYQNDKTIRMYDANLVNSSLNVDGTLSDSPITYPDMVKLPAEGGFFNKKCTFMNTRGIDYATFRNDLYGGTMQTTLEIAVPEI